MSELQQFVRSFSDNDRLILVASRIPGRIRRIDMGSESNGLEIVLALEKDIPDGEDLILFEYEIRNELVISHVRLHLTGEALLNVAEMVVGPLRCWVTAAISRQNPLLCALSKETDFEAEGHRIVGTVRYSADPLLMKDFVQKAEQFTENYLPRKCVFEMKSNEKDADKLTRERIMYFEKKILREAEEALSKHESISGGKSKPSNGSGSFGASSKTQSSAKTASDHSWEHKAGQVVKESEGYQRKKPRGDKSDGPDWGRMNDTLPIAQIGDLNESTGTALFEGNIEIEDMRLTKDGKKVCVKFFMTDDTGSISCVYFPSPKDTDRFSEAFSLGGYARIQANVCFDARYTRDLSAAVVGIRIVQGPQKREDNALMKRVELHCHSKMSEKDAVVNVADLIEEAARMGHSAFALTDHGVAQGFPEAAEAAARVRKLNPDRPFKVIYGMEGYLVDDGPCPVYIPDEIPAPAHAFIVLRVETTGADPISDSMVSVRAARFKQRADGNFECSDTLFEQVPSVNEIEAYVGTKKSSADLFPMLERIAEFIGQDAVCGTDVLAGLSFLRYAGFDADIENHVRYRVKFNPVTIDIEALSEAFRGQEALWETTSPEGSIPTNDNEYDDHLKRDAATLANAIRHLGVSDFSDLNNIAGKAPRNQILSRKQNVHHIVLLAKNNLGLYHMYRLISESHLHYFSMRPRIPKSLLRYFRDGLILGSACERGEVFSRIRTHYTMSNYDYDAASILLKEDPSFLHICAQYDYLEIQPLTNNAFFLRDPETGLRSEEDIKNLNRLVLFAGDTLGIPVCATTDAHFLEKKDGEYRKYLMMDMGYKDAEFGCDLYFRTTQEMLDEFSYLGEDRAAEVVVTNTNLIAERISSEIKPFPHGTFPPVIDIAAEEITRVTWKAVSELYTFQGKTAPIVEDRVNKELDSIIGHGFAIMYYIAYMLVKKSNEDGYIVGSRGSVGSSLVATLCGFTEVNPLPPHYRCPGCSHSEFDNTGRYGSGYDLPLKDCPHCGTEMKRDGQEIPFETFLGFYGDKQPDIDLNFSGEYQTRAHHYVEELFGASHTFRAGTISCFADKNAEAVVQKITEQSEERISRAELRRRSLGLIGVKRTTGQHPGGIVVVPREMDIYEFTPIQHPANKADAGVITTHFDFKSMHDTILKLDILGHDDPTVLRMLGDLTGIDVRMIEITDPKVLSLFVSTDALGIRDPSYNTDWRPSVYPKWVPSWRAI
jgi:DNA polymerase-3 subunit alpha (Gram-positive type)